MIWIGPSVRPPSRENPVRSGQESPRFASSAPRQIGRQHTDPEYNAGFCDPGFGYGAGLRGTQAVFEVRAHDVPFMLEDGQPIARLAFERMAEPPSVLYGSGELGSHFQRQGVQLSRQFKAPEASIRFQMTSGR